MTLSGSPSRGRRPQLPEEVAVHLREQIVTGKVSKGEYLRLDQLAEDLGISVTPVREALITLSAEGFVELEPRQGFAVVPPSAADMADMFELQATIAGKLAGRAALRMGAETGRELESLQAELVEADEGGMAPAAAETLIRFHRELNRAAGSPKLAWFFEIAARYAPRETTLAASGWVTACARDHPALLGALAQGDAATAEAGMFEHIQDLGNRLISHLSELGSWSETAR